MGVTKRIPTVKMAIFVFKDYSAPDKTLDKQHRTFTPGQSGGQAAGDNIELLAEPGEHEPGPDCGEQGRSG